jgi:acyl carrier protein
MHDADTSNVLRSIAGFLGELNVQLPPGDVSATTFLFEGGLELDSFTVVELLGRIEEHFGMAFHDEDFAPERFTLGALAAIVEARTARRA